MQFFKVTLCLSFLIILLCFNPQSLAYSPFLDEVIYQYNSRFSCNLCHREAKLNKFGEDFKREYNRLVIDNTQNKYTNDVLELTLKNIEDSDSDGDGWLNGVELMNGTLPGDKFSHPR